MPDRHAAGGAPVGQIVAEPTYAERARTLLHLGRVGTLSTHSRKRPGWPFGSVMPYAPDAAGRPVFLISTMAMHTQNLGGDGRASLLVAEPAAGADPLGMARVTLLGNAARVPAEETGAVRLLYLARHESARYWVDFEDFAFYRLELVDVYFVGGFGVMGWVDAGEYSTAQPDPLADVAAGILEHVNADHADALRLMARVLAGIDAAKAVMTSVDYLGFHLRVETPERVRGARLAFPRPARNAQEARAVVVEMVAEARRRAGCD